MSAAAGSAAAALAVAFAIGFAFGWLLERAGLGSARKLVGQFYLTDLTVFKVLFSALVTAMLGAFWLDRVGVLDLGARVRARDVRGAAGARRRALRRRASCWPGCVRARRASRPRPDGATGWR